MDIYTGKTVEEALESASQKLNIPVNELIYLVSDKKTGLFSKKFQVYALPRACIAGSGKTGRSGISR